MKKLSIILCTVCCLSLLAGCDADLSGSSSIIPEEVVSAGKSTTSATATTTTAAVTGDTGSTEETTAATGGVSTATASSTNNKPANKPSSTANKPSSTAKPTTTATTTTTTTTTTKASTTTAKKNHGTPNVNGTFRDDMADAVLVLLNKARKEEGLGELTMDRGNMMNAARIRAKEITVHWAHERPDGDSVWTAFTEEGVKYNMRGENLADGHMTVEAVFKGWMDSPGHKANMMEPRFTHVSIVCLEVDGHFYWVQLFGANIR